MKKADLLMIAAALGVLYVAGKGVVSYMGRLSISDLKTLAANIGFGSDASVAAAIAMAESSGDPNAIGDVDVPVPGAQSYGLWQINSYYHPEFGPDFSSLFNPQINANAAYLVYKAAGFSFSPWSAFKNGAYTAYLSGAQSA